jgi:hypothetical protein
MGQMMVSTSGRDSKISKPMVPRTVEDGGFRALLHVVEARRVDQFVTSYDGLRRSRCRSTMSSAAEALHDAVDLWVVAFRDTYGHGHVEPTSGGRPWPAVIAPRSHQYAALQLLNPTLCWMKMSAPRILTTRWGCGSRA